MATIGPLLAAMAGELRAEMARQKMTGRELSRLSGIPHNTQQRYLSGDSAATPDDLDAIARALGTDLFAVHSVVVARRGVTDAETRPTASARRVTRGAKAVVSPVRTRATKVVTDDYTAPVPARRTRSAAVTCYAVTAA